MSEERLPLQNGIVYGPVKSRRLGSSLGINISPYEIKMCSFNCAYCQYPSTGLLVRDGKSFRNILPTRKEIEKALREFIRKLEKDEEKVDFLTFSGNGEPTLHPDFAEIVDDVIKIRNSIKSKPKIASLSNSTTVHNQKIFDALNKIDEPIMKLDAGNEKMFKILNRPSKGIDFNLLISQLANFEGNLTIQSLFVEGEVDNTTEEELETHLQKLKIIKPGCVQIYSLDRPPAFKKIHRVAKRKLESIKLLLLREINSNVVVY